MQSLGSRKKTDIQSLIPTMDSEQPRYQRRREVSDELKIRQERIIEYPNGYKVTDATEIVMTHSERLWERKQLQLRETCQAMPSKTEQEIVALKQRLTSLDVSDLLFEFDNVSQWFKNFLEHRRQEFRDERALEVATFLKSQQTSKPMQKPYYVCTNQEITDILQWSKDNEGEWSERVLRKEIAEQCREPNFYEEMLETLGYTMELFILNSSSIPFGVQVTPIAGTFRLQKARNILAWDHVRQVEDPPVGYFDVTVATAQGDLFSPVPMRACVLHYAPSTRDATRSVWSVFMDGLSFETAPKELLSPDVAAGLKAKALIANLLSMDLTVMPDFIRYVCQFNPQTGQPTTVKQSEDTQWYELQCFVVEMEQLCKQGATAYLSEHEQDVYLRHRRYMNHVNETYRDRMQADNQPVSEAVMLRPKASEPFQRKHTRS